MFPAKIQRRAGLVRYLLHLVPMVQGKAVAFQLRPVHIHLGTTGQIQPHRKVQPVFFYPEIGCHISLLTRMDRLIIGGICKYAGGAQVHYRNRYRYKIPGQQHS